MQIEKVRKKRGIPCLIVHPNENLNYISRDILVHVHYYCREVIKHLAAFLSAVVHTQVVLYHLDFSPTFSSCFTLLFIMRWL